MHFPFLIKNFYTSVADVVVLAKGPLVHYYNNLDHNK